MLTLRGSANLKHQLIYTAEIAIDLNIRYSLKNLLGHRNRVLLSYRYISERARASRDLVSVVESLEES